MEVLMQSFLMWSGIVTRYGLHGPRIKSQCWQFSAPVQTGPETHPALYTIVTGSFLGVKWPGRGVDVKERVAISLLHLWPFMACSRVNFTMEQFLTWALDGGSSHFKPLSLYNYEKTLVPTKLEAACTQQSVWTFSTRWYLLSQPRFKPQTIHFKNLGTTFKFLVPEI
jgi:hypothetical protein